ncbi:hypothetical protein [Flavobacterium hydrophilum]|uniref:Uncharacterized protein n=1 Tax=Flavobacterium hydrophilum TaxID=2211445 RepID=A0A2V4BWB0_9FLAO|nr:hypothetical protein [Flavobacterium hydrophilum]PXY43276.1 hypothetical protein DMB68_21595 [Flavobacterium hydrophilum]
MNKKISICTLILALTLSARLFCGVYIHDEFAESHFFIKHKPTWKWEFYSPQGMSDLKFEDLSKEKQIEQNILMNI